MRVVVTIPAYNEEKTIRKVIRNIKEIMDREGYNYKIMVIDDGSTDSTAEIAKKEGVIIHSHPYNYGLAETFKTEMEKILEMDSDIIVHIDADGQYEPAEIPKLIQPIIKGEADFVLGSRFKGSIEKMSFLKRWGNKAFSRVISKITGIRITDAQSGYRAFTRDVARKIKIKSDYTYTQEMIIRAVKNKFKIKEVPIKSYKTRKSKLMKSPLDFAFRAWINILRVYRDYEPLKFFGSIGSVFMIISFILGMHILISFFIGGLASVYQKIPTILLTVLLFTVGLQILLFGFLADKD